MPSLKLGAYCRLARLHKPVGIFLFFWPFAWGLFMSAQTIQLPLSAFLKRLGSYAIGSVLLRSAACVLNDICDLDIDARVERTKKRPLVTGDVTIPGAILFLVLLSAACLFMLSFASPKALMPGLFGFFVLNGLYPIMKRFTYWPQAWLGLAINWGFIVAWLDVTDGRLVRVSSLIPGMLGLLCWTIAYDTIYACQDVADDAKIGVKSTAILFGEHVHMIVMLFAASFISLLGITGYMNSQGPAFFLISVLGAGCHITWQLYTLEPQNASNCQERFVRNIDLGAIVATGLALDYLHSIINPITVV